MADATTPISNTQGNTVQQRDATPYEVPGIGTVYPGEKPQDLVPATTPIAPVVPSPNEPSEQPSPSGPYVADRYPGANTTDIVKPAPQGAGTVIATSNPDQFVVREQIKGGSAGDYTQSILTKDKVLALGLNIPSSLPNSEGVVSGIWTPELAKGIGNMAHVDVLTSMAQKNVPFEQLANYIKSNPDLADVKHSNLSDGNLEQVKSIIDTLQNQGLFPRSAINGILPDEYVQSLKDNKPIESFSDKDYTKIGINTNNPQVMKKLDADAIKKQDPEGYDILISKGVESYIAFATIKEQEKAQALINPLAQKAGVEHNPKNYTQEDIVKLLSNGVTAQDMVNAGTNLSVISATLTKIQEDADKWVDALDSNEQTQPIKDAYVEAKKTGNFDTFTQLVEDYNPNKIQQDAISKLQQATGVVGVWSPEHPAPINPEQYLVDNKMSTEAMKVVQDAYNDPEIVSQISSQAQARLDTVKYVDDAVKTWASIGGGSPVGEGSQDVSVIKVQADRLGLIKEGSPGTYTEVGGNLAVPGLQALTKILGGKETEDTDTSVPYGQTSIIDLPKFWGGLSDKDKQLLAENVANDPNKSSYLAAATESLNAEISKMGYVPLVLAIVAPEIGMPILLAQSLANAVSPYTIPASAIINQVKSNADYLKTNPALSSDDSKILSGVEKQLGIKSSDPISAFNNANSSTQDKIATEFTRIQLGIQPTDMQKINAGLMTVATATPYIGPVIARLGTAGKLTNLGLSAGVAGGFITMSAIEMPKMTAEERTVALGMDAVMLAGLARGIGSLKNPVMTDAARVKAENAVAQNKTPEGLSTLQAKVEDQFAQSKEAKTKINTPDIVASDLYDAAYTTGKVIKDAPLTIEKALGNIGDSFEVINKAADDVMSGRVAGEVTGKVQKAVADVKQSIDDVSKSTKSAYDTAIDAINTSVEPLNKLADGVMSGKYSGATAKVAADTIANIQRGITRLNVMAHQGYESTVIEINKSLDNINKLFERVASGEYSDAVKSALRDAIQDTNRGVQRLMVMAKQGYESSIININNALEPINSFADNVMSGVYSDSARTKFTQAVDSVGRELNSLKNSVQSSYEVGVIKTNEVAEHINDVAVKTMSGEYATEVRNAATSLKNNIARQGLKLSREARVNYGDAVIKVNNAVDRINEIADGVMSGYYSGALKQDLESQIKLLKYNLSSDYDAVLKRINDAVEHINTVSESAMRGSDVSKKGFADAIGGKAKEESSVRDIVQRYRALAELRKDITSLVVQKKLTPADIDRLATLWDKANLGDSQMIREILRPDIRMTLDDVQKALSNRNVQQLRDAAEKLKEQAKDIPKEKGGEVISNRADKIIKDAEKIIESYRDDTQFTDNDWKEIGDWISSKYGKEQSSNVDNVVDRKLDEMDAQFKDLVKETNESARLQKIIDILKQSQSDKPPMSSEESRLMQDIANDKLQLLARIDNRLAKLGFKPEEIQGMSESQKLSEASKWTDTSKMASQYGKLGKPLTDAAIEFIKQVETGQVSSTDITPNLAKIAKDNGVESSNARDLYRQLLERKVSNEQARLDAITLEMQKSEFTNKSNPEEQRLMGEIAQDRAKLANLGESQDARYVDQLRRRIADNEGKLTEMRGGEDTADTVAKALDDKLIERGYKSEDIAKMTEREKLEAISKDEPPESRETFEPKSPEERGDGGVGVKERTGTKKETKTKLEEQIDEILEGKTEETKPDVKPEEKQSAKTQEKTAQTTKTEEAPKTKEKSAFPGIKEKTEFEPKVVPAQGEPYYAYVWESGILTYRKVYPEKLVQGYVYIQEQPNTVILPAEEYGRMTKEQIESLLKSATRTSPSLETEGLFAFPSPTPSPAPSPYPQPSPLPTPEPTPSPVPIPEPFPTPVPEPFPMPVPPTEKPPKVKPPIVVPLPSPQSIAESLKGGVTPGTWEWRQGKKWVILPPPYTNDVKRFIDAPLPGTYRFATGKGSAKATIQVLGGIPTEDADIDMGWAGVQVRIEGKEPTISFVGGKQAADTRWKQEAAKEAAQAEQPAMAMVRIPVPEPEPIVEPQPIAQPVPSGSIVTPIISESEKLLTSDEMLIKKKPKDIEDIPDDTRMYSMLATSDVAESTPESTGILSQSERLLPDVVNENIGDKSNPPPPAYVSPEAQLPLEEQELVAGKSIAEQSTGSFKKPTKAETDAILGLEKQELPQYRAGRFRMYSVNDEFVRNNYFQDWGQGGHDKVYPKFIPPNEGWISNKLERMVDQPAFVGHEMHERVDMTNGLSYEDAHNNANEFEKTIRGNPKNASGVLYDWIKDREINGVRPSVISRQVVPKLPRVIEEIEELEEQPLRKKDYSEVLKDIEDEQEEEPVRIVRRKATPIPAGRTYLGHVLPSSDLGVSL